ncbi:phosphogluconate dehydrogenase (NAD(+)-dependent, decarboxylating) [Natronoglycomyces albus]|uniref:Decarboxylating 6-phosphogluconate dehydrogenase n=1 Tax=Natronoglycomyces albus TaxID=2811108 RepID=A0A895XQF6_9ACTN|nr:decarboxylating 6-phosphogluconate dehydrogenase [Natronoglycomyces albus]QSB05375.1 decarboxylating 6-phosphogluconate dehydrogenase [Natronoglycomyces albus]
MQLGMIGLGKMGGNMKRRLQGAGHEVIGYDLNPAGADVDSLGALVEQLEAPRVVWVMVPAGEPTRATVFELAELLEPGDIVVEGGNSRFSDDAANAEVLAKRGIGYVDAGVSGGVWGYDNGYALMVGGEETHVRFLKPIFDSLIPEGGYGFVHAGGVGAGHYAKMIHNGIEYGMMAAYAEGYELLEASEYIDNPAEVIKSWRGGTVVRSWLLDLLDRALDADPSLEAFQGKAQDSGEGRWTVDEAVRLGVPAHVITASLFARFASRQDDAPAMKAIQALRNQFGGHNSPER